MVRVGLQNSRTGNASSKGGNDTSAPSVKKKARVGDRHNYFSSHRLISKIRKNLERVGVPLFAALVRQEVRTGDDGQPQRHVLAVL